jgi:hypothetical protein
MNLEKFFESANQDPKLIVEEYAKQYAKKGGFGIATIDDEYDPTALKFQLVRHPQYDRSQVIATGKEDTVSFLETLVDALESDHPQFYWKNGLTFKENPGGSVLIVLNPNELSEAA